MKNLMRDCAGHLSIPRAWILEASWTLVAVGPVEAFAALRYLRHNMHVTFGNPKQKARFSKEIYFNFHCYNKQHSSLPSPPPSMNATFSSAEGSLTGAQLSVCPGSAEGRPQVPAQLWYQANKTGEAALMGPLFYPVREETVCLKKR